jgi:hypothetical protein
MTDAELRLMRVRAQEGRTTREDALALLAEIERLERELALAHGTIAGLKDVLYDRVAK